MAEALKSPERVTVTAGSIDDRSSASDRADDRWLAIFNPAAGRTRRSRAWSDIERAFARAGLRFDVAITAAAGDGEDIAARAIRAGRRRFLVAGGDGSVHEAVNGIMRAHRSLPSPPTLVPLPLGTGNDWARSLSLPRDPDRLAAIVRADRGFLHDVGRIDFPASSARPGSVCWFINVAGAGFDAHVIEHTPAQTPSRFAYLGGALARLRRYRSPAFRISSAHREQAAGRFLLVFVANGQYCGHRMHVAPSAALDDGRLDVVTIDEVGLLAALPKLLKLYRGTILRDPLVRHFLSTSVQIDADPAAPVEADGQLVGRTPAVFSLEPRALRVLHGRPA